MKTTNPGRTGLLLKWTALLVVILHLSPAVSLAGPEGAEVVSGIVRFGGTGNYTTIHASDRAIIDYQTFNIGLPETVEFIQPSSTASVLNRILSASPTTIDGTLLANGRVFFVNPAGIIFGESARVNVTQLIASALNISNTDFINGNYVFSDGAGSVVNKGNIEAERAYLIGRQVANFGNIDCPGGYAVLAAGERVFLGVPGSDLFVEVEAPKAPEAPVEGAAVANEGTINAGSGKIILAAAGDLYSQAISNVGTLSASVEAGDAGQVELTAPDGLVTNAGDIEAVSRGGAGGTVHVLGDRVSLVDDAHIDVSGATGGGTVLVGGDYQGKGELPTASRTYVGPSASIKADAGRSGDGGKIIVWADDATSFQGHASAQGGHDEGNGGLVEVSAKEHLDFRGTVDTRAPEGDTGTLLLDPAAIEVVAGGSLVLADVDAFLDAGSDPAVSQIDPDRLEEAGTNVDLQARDTILFSDSVTMLNDGVGITARAGDDITVAAPITTRGGALNFTANDSGGNQSGDGSILVNDALDTTGGGLAGAAITLTVSGGTGSIQLGGSVTTGAAGQIYAGPATLGTDVTLTGSTVSFGNTVEGTAAGSEQLNVTGNAAFA
ncbi:MAG: filamentous hemagglutinin N-terminal domain-containing protein, partial [Sedimentisphaerales bacterium]|nr:filamentous hemagglutinin N-terminal domain-containing protein [Sedimentisphaerales bacterium]